MRSRMAAHESPQTIKLYDRTKDEIKIGEVERFISVVFLAHQLDPRAQIVHDYFSRAKELIPTMITALDNFKYDMVRLRPVLPCHHSLVDLRVERLPQTFYRFNPMAAQQLIKLLQGNLNALTELLHGTARASTESPFEVVDY